MFPNSPISAIMTTNLVTARPGDYISKITESFNKNEFHHIPVVTDGQKLVGIISREDLQKVANLVAATVLEDYWNPSSKTALTATDIMTKYPLSLSPDDSIGLAADIVLANRFHAIPVVEDDELVGIVTSHDLLAFAFNSPVETVDTF